MPERTRGRAISALIVSASDARPADRRSARGRPGLLLLARRLAVTVGALRWQRNAQSRDAPAVDLCDTQARGSVAIAFDGAPGLDDVPDAGQPSQNGHHVPRDRFVRSFR